MTRKVALVGGGALVVAGFVLALLALAIPWAHVRLAVDVPVEGADLDHSGGIAVFQFFAVLGLVAGAAAAASPRRWYWRSVAPCCRSAPSQPDAYPG